MQLNISVAVDFTASNGTPSSPSSLHYTGSGNNPYQQAIQQVGQIVVEYDTDKMVSAFGFGGKVDGVHKDVFPLNMNQANPFVKSWQGVLEAYKLALSKTSLNAPTNFAPVIKQIASAAGDSMRQNPKLYHVLMIVTDGEVTDFTDTVNAVVQASELPMSIIIIGVGKAGFGQMDKLDGDRQALTGKGGKKGRDIVQFVKHLDFIGNNYGLAEAVLKELPSQINKFYTMMGMQPR